MSDLEQSVSEWKQRASELERERDEAREAAATARQPYVKLEIEHGKEVSAHKRTKRGAHHSPRVGPRAVRVAGGLRSPVVVRAEVGLQSTNCREPENGPPSDEEVRQWATGGCLRATPR